MRREARRSGVVFTGMTVLETLEYSPLGGGGGSGGWAYVWRGRGAAATTHGGVTSWRRRRWVRQVSRGPASSAGAPPCKESTAVTHTQ